MRTSTNQPKWKRSRLLSGGTIVLMAAVWTGPQMAGAAPERERERAAATAPGGDAQNEKPDDPRKGEKAKPGATTTTTAAPKPTTTAPPKSGGTGGGGGGGKTSPGGGNGGGGNAAPNAGSGAAPNAGGGAVPAAPASGSVGTGGSTPSANRSSVTRPRDAGADARPSAAVPSAPVPEGPGHSSIAALQAPDGAAQATVRSMGSGQAMGPTGGLSLYAQLAAAPGPLPSDGDAGNPYVTFVILSVFGLGVCATGRRRRQEDQGMGAFAAA